MRAAVRFTSPFRWLSALGLAWVVTLAWAAPARPPTSKLYVADLEGESEINTGERIERLDEKSVHNAHGAILETKEESSTSVVLSNGTGVYLGPSTRLEIRRFVQEPFWPNREDLEVEPSISQLLAFLARGTLGICTPKLVAGSTMTVETRHASVSIRGQRLLIETTAAETRVSVIEGDVTVRAGEGDSGGATLRGGQQAWLRQQPGQPLEMVVQDIPEDQLEQVREKVAMSCMARRTVYFDVGDGDSETVVIPVVPIRPPVDFVDDDTVSASRIRG